MDEHLDGLSHIVHDVLKRLKMGETGTITCSKEYQHEEVRLYVNAYALHKHKWFETRYDKATNTIIAKRTEQPKWNSPDKLDSEEEL
jgi:hypothetical protein